MLYMKRYSTSIRWRCACLRLPLYALEKRQGLCLRVEELLFKRVLDGLSESVIKLGSESTNDGRLQRTYTLEKQAAARILHDNRPTIGCFTESAFERRNKRTEADLLGKRILSKFINIAVPIH